VSRKLSRYEGIIHRVDTLTESLDDAEVLLELGAEEGDESIRAEVVESLRSTDEILASLETESLYFGEYDDHTAIFSIHAGAGGVDAQDWTEMMYRMYTRYFDSLGLNYEVDEVSPGDEAGIKSVTMTVNGAYAYGQLEGERGVHRLVRISPFDANARRHTSFAAVDVVPQVDDAEIEVNQDDLRIDTFRSSGAGGQHVNTTDSAVRITHLPTGIVAACQAERSQIQNRAKAMTMLKAKLADLARHERQQELDEIRGEQNEAAWGRQIRSYVLQPYQMVKDLRTNLEIGNVGAVLDGSVGALTESYLQWRRSGRERAEQ
jgi:peptide chain release factor 2